MSHKFRTPMPLAGKLIIAGSAVAVVTSLVYDAVRWRKKQTQEEKKTRSRE